MLDAARVSATVEAEGVRLVVRPSAWHGSPAYLPSYVTPFHLTIVNAHSLPLQYDYADLRLFDEARFQYTALPPAEVERILRAAGAGEGVLTAAAEPVAAPILRRRFVRDPVRDPWWWGPPSWDPWWWYPPYSYPPPRLDDVYLEALPVGTVQAGAWTQGFVYFPRLRPGVRRLALEFHHRLGDAPRVLIVLFGVVP